MVYLPRHFLVNNYNAVAAALSVEAYCAILRPATGKSAFDRCSATARTLNQTPDANFRYCFQRLSQRGGGRFSIDEPDTPQCYMFEGLFTGAMRFHLGAHGAAPPLDCNECNCAADGCYAACCFTLAARS
jgi:hypothetical protein